MDVEAHLGHVFMYFEPYELIGNKIRTIGDQWSDFWTLLLFFVKMKQNHPYIVDFPYSSEVITSSWSAFGATLGANIDDF